MLEYGKALHNISQYHKGEHFCWGKLKGQRARGKQIKSVYYSWKSEEDNLDAFQGRPGDIRTCSLFLDFSGHISNVNTGILNL